MKIDQKPTIGLQHGAHLFPEPPTLLLARQATGLCLLPSDQELGRLGKTGSDDRSGE
jgi:hypothetical protein